MTSACSRCSSSRWCSWTPPATIPTGAMAERWKFSSFVVFAFFMSMFVYPVYRQLGLGRRLAVGARQRTSASATATSTSPARRSSTWSAAWRRSPGAIVLGPRIGKYNKDGTAERRFPATTSRWRSLGTFILAFGWFGFNAGLDAGRRRPAHRRRRGQHDARRRAAGALRRDDLRVGAATASPIPSMMCNGMLAGLVAITAPCAFVNSVVGGHHRRHRRRAGRRGGVLRRADAEDRRSGRRDRRPRRLRRLRRALASASSPTAPTATAGTACPVHGPRPVLRRCLAARGAVGRHPDQHRLRLRRLLRVLQGRRRGHRQPRRRGRRRSKASTCPEMGVLGYPGRCAVCQAGSDGHIMVPVEPAVAVQIAAADIGPSGGLEVSRRSAPRRCSTRRAGRTEHETLRPVTAGSELLRLVDGPPRSDPGCQVSDPVKASCPARLERTRSARASHRRGRVDRRRACPARD